jgi:hypothetical protein
VTHEYKRDYHITPLAKPVFGEALAPAPPPPREHPAFGPGGKGRPKTNKKATHLPT